MRERNKGSEGKGRIKGEEDVIREERRDKKRKGKREERRGERRKRGRETRQ